MKDVDTGQGDPERDVELLRAIQFAADKHRLQRRKDHEASPYINHPIAVAHLLAEIGGVRDLATLMAAVLHDTIEDTDTSGKELEAVFGRKVRRLVEEVTDDKELHYAERKSLQIEHAPDLTPQAKLIKIADKTSNLADLINCPPTEWSIERRREYLEWSEKVVAGCRGVSPPLEQRFDELLAQGRKKLF